ncbi:hypothetical protein [Filimonas effusa]|uniref:Uncharacterized protein n=1 Tax=Filimonas effusa TaxID=2508721 RepID=A0A4Q1D0Y7_9BACT|nr:hypothetical protein [Filimonas effusa]RXK81433.1 hypothetical protein ESB13_21105 [Filimonas effusa]
MAKQTGPVIWEKTIGPVSFYKRCGVGCVRMKSNLTTERWRSDPVFAGSRKSAARLALAATLASAFYQTIPEQHRNYPHYKQLVGVAQHMFCKGYDIQQVNKVLHFTISRYLRKLEAANPNRKPVRSPFAAIHSLKTKPVFTKAVRHQLAAPQVRTIAANSAAFKQWPVIMPPRGSPTSITGYCQGTSALLSHSAICSLMASLSMSLPAQSATLFPDATPKTPEKHPENIPGNNFLPFGFLIVP